MTFLTQILMMIWIAFCFLPYLFAQDPKLVLQLQTWSQSKENCLKNGGQLLPDHKLDSGEIVTHDHLKDHHFTWINTKTLKVIYPASEAYLKFTYQPLDTQLGYFCYNNAQNIKKMGEQRSWTEANSSCAKEKRSFYGVTTTSQAKAILPLMAYYTSFWLNNFDDDRITSMVQQDPEYVERCVGIIKSNGSLFYRQDNCSNKHYSICTNSKLTFQPTVTRLKSEILTLNASEFPATEMASNFTEAASKPKVEPGGLREGTLSGIAVGCVFGVLLVLGVIASVYFVKRWKNRKNYRKREKRYISRQHSGRHLLNTTMSTNTTITNGRSTLSSRGTLNDNRACDVEASGQMEYEDYEKQQQYQDCQREVVLECNRILQNREARYSKDPLVIGSSAELSKLPPTYSSMDGTATIQVLPGYEDYNPEIERLKNYDTPIKKKKNQSLEDLDQYENYNHVSLKPGEPIVINKDHVYNKTKKTESLDDLDQYENHSIPPRRAIGKVTYKHAGKTENVKKQRIVGDKSKSNIRNEAKVQSNMTDQEPENADEYENFRVPTLPPKTNKMLDQLDTYENLALKK